MFGERRLVALIDAPRGSAATSLARAPSRSSTYRSHWPSLNTVRVSTAPGRCVAFERERRARAASASRPLAEEEVGPNAGGQSGREEPRFGVGPGVERASSASARCGGGLRKVDGARVHRDRTLAAGLDERVARGGQCLFGEGDARPTLPFASSRSRPASAAPEPGDRRGSRSALSSSSKRRRAGSRRRRWRSLGHVEPELVAADPAPSGSQLEARAGRAPPPRSGAPRAGGPQCAAAFRSCPGQLRIRTLAWRARGGGRSPPDRTPAAASSAV